ncbi:MAG: hypothetical protein P4M07_16120 [Xanthobacteraceae bacterium]|nr:hypothetical protein [Xanthobacteraceae bacterium]
MSTPIASSPQPGLRLRQICLVAPALEPVVGDLAAIFGLEVCHRDPNVARYGLENALLPIDSILLEVVAPVQEDTAAGRFLARSGGRGGYMAIFACRDPAERKRNAEQLGVRVAHEIDRPPYHGVQLHPRDCRGAFIEFNTTAGSDNIFGPYPPAGPDWTRSIRREVTRSLSGVEMQSPDPASLAAHWGRLLSVAPRAAHDGSWEIALVNATFRFTLGPREAMTGLDLEVADPAAVFEVARRRGYAVGPRSFAIGGVDLRLAGR